MVAASGFAPPRGVALCPRPRGGGHRLGFLRSAPPVAAVGAQLRCCASTVDAPKPLLPRVVSIGSKFIGCGSATPELSVSNDDLSKIVDTSDEWITARTGIRNRRILSGDETLRGLSVQATQRALEMAEVKADDVDMLILCTSTPDDLFGGAHQLLTEVGCKNADASGFDLTAACSGFINGLITAAQYINGGCCRNVLVVGADALSRYVDWTDRSTCILFGDAAGAVFVQACSADENCLLGHCTQSDGNGQKHLNCVASNMDSIFSKTNGVPSFPPKKGTFSCIEMNGTEVFRFAVRRVPQSIEKALEHAGLTASSIDWLLLHQANQRIIDAVASRLAIPSDKAISNLANYGNTSAASIPLALDEAVRGGKVNTGDVIAASGFGAGLSWGSAIFKWG